MKDPDLGKYLNKKVSVQLSSSREIRGELKGFDAFLNLVIESAVDTSNPRQPVHLGTSLIRGVSVLSVVEI